MTYSTFTWYKFVTEPEVLDALEHYGWYEDANDWVLIEDVDEKLIEVSKTFPEVTIKVYASGEEPFDFSAKTFLGGKLIFFSNLDSIFPDLNDNNITKFD